MRKINEIFYSLQGEGYYTGLLLFSSVSPDVT